MFQTCRALLLFDVCTCMCSCLYSVTCPAFLPSSFPSFFFLPFLKVSIITIITFIDYIMYPLQNHIFIFSFVYSLLIFSRFKMSRCLLPFLFLHCVCTFAFYIQRCPNVVILPTISWAWNDYDAINVIIPKFHVWCWFNFHKLSYKQVRTKGRAA
jgi:hypothetical protein